MKSKCEKIGMPVSFEVISTVEFVPTLTPKNGLAYLPAFYKILGKNETASSNNKK